jgi:heme/copper-type cytochrome/quinol oxidase subunit 3
VTTITAEHEDPQDQGRAIEVVAGHHETHEQRHFKERMALWLFIGGDALFLLMELFFWFYLRALNTNGLWRGDACSTAHPCTDGLGNAITQEVHKASASYTVIIAGLSVVVALLVWAVERAAQNREHRSVVTGIATLSLVVLLGAIAVQCYQFGTLPFTTVDGTYASTFLFFMGSTLAHLMLLAFIGIGLANRARLGRYDDGNWYQVHLIRIFAVWIATSVCVLALVMSLLA